MNSKRFATATTGTLLVSATILTGSAIPATAAQTPAAPASVTTVAAAPEAVHAKRAATIARYGIYPLPVCVRGILRFRLTKKQLRDIAAARRLANSPIGRRVKMRESGNNYRYADGRYFGAWNFDRGTWLSNGGGRFGATANRAPAWAQDYIMWRTHKARGWSPWPTAY